MRRLTISVMALALMLGFGPASARAAQISPIRYDAKVEYEFARWMKFELSASSDTRITGATLFYQSGSSRLQQIAAPVEPGMDIHTEVSIELRGGVLPPFSRVTFWWEIDSEGRPVWPVPRQTIDYVDNRIDWQRLSNGGVTVHWSASDGGAAFAESILDTALDALPRLTAEIGAAPPSSIDVYVYPSREDLITAMRLGGRDWAGGQARPELGVVLVDIPATATASVEMRRAVPHELTHLMVYAATQPGYDNVPAWLDEGLATANEASPDPAQAVALEAAVQSGTLIAFRTLCAPFPADADQILLAYAQSGDLAHFIRDRYGAQGVRNLLAAYREGATCEAGVQRALGVTLPALEDAWRAQIGSSGAVVGALAETSAPWIALIAVMLIALLPVLGGLPRRKT